MTRKLSLDEDQAPDHFASRRSALHSGRMTSAGGSHRESMGHVAMTGTKDEEKGSSNNGISH